MRRNLTFLLVNTLIASVLLFFIWGEWSRGVNQRRMIPAEGERHSVHITVQPGIAQLGKATLGSYAEIVERPLFSNGRRPAPEAQVHGGDPHPTDIDKLMLTGIVTGPDTKLAIFINTAQKNELRLSQGHAFSGWRLGQFAEDHVTFSRGEENRQLPLYRDREATALSQQVNVRTNGALQRFLTRRQRSRDTQQ